MKASINSLHHQTSDWLRELEFYKQELTSLQKRLEEVAAKNTTKDIMTQVEHFQNRFTILREQHDILHHENTIRLSRVDELAKSRPEHIDEKFMTENGEMHKKVNDFSASFRDTRFEFNTFLSRVM